MSVFHKKYYQDAMVLQSGADLEGAPPKIRKAYVIQR